MKCSLFRYLRVVALLLLVTPGAFAFSSPLWANAPSGWAQDGLIKFQVLRNDSPLGVVMLRFKVDNDVYTVDTQTLFDYRIGPFSVYYYALRARDEWSGPLLLSARGMVNDDGEIFRVDGETGPEGFRFSGGEGEQLATLGTSVPSTYWNTALTRASELIDLQYGRLRKITMTKVGPDTILSKGERIEAERYQMRGELDLDIWYDKRGEWAKMSFTVDDSNFEYVRIVPRAGDETRFLELESVKDIGSEEIRNVLRELE